MFLSFLLLAFLLSNASGSPEFPDTEFGFSNRSDFTGKLEHTSDGRIIAYMNPPYQTNHASFIAGIPGGLGCAWFSGSSEGNSDVAIVFSQLQDGSDQWTTPVVLSRRQGFSNQNPVLFFNNYTGIVHLFHSQQPAINDEKPIPEGEGEEAYATVWELQSTDNGDRWTTPRIAFTKPGTFDRNRIITLDEGRTWLFPMYSTAGSEESQEYSFISFSNDFGETWSQVEFPDTSYLVQPSVIHLPGSYERDLRVFFRDRRSQHIYTATSSNSGVNWTSPIPTPLPNNNAAIQSIPLLSGRVAIVFDDTTDGRIPLTIALSEDGGQTWPYKRNLDPPDNSSGDTSSLEFSYPSIIQTSDQNLHITYTYNRDTIKYVQCDENWVMGK